MDEQIKSELDELIRLGRKYVWGSVEIRRYLENGRILLSPPGYYSPLPTIQEIEAAFEYSDKNGFWFRPDIFDDEELKKNIANLTKYSAEFNPPVDGNKLNPDGFFLNNGLFSFSDATAYYSIIRERKPRQIIEIGSGFSTLVALEAVRKNGSGKICCIEPYPRDFLAKLDGVELIQNKVQDIDISFFNSRLTTNDILFIDSSHAVKIGSDTQYIHLHIVPRLTSTVLIHVHDVFLPFPMPKHWELAHQIHWTEQYLVLAYLLDNPKCSVFFASDYNARKFPEEMARLMWGRCQSGGGSFWYQRHP
jgi:hypothetical protein